MLFQCVSHVQRLPQLDHDHKKQKGDVGFLRGWLCHKCNTGGGKFNDDPELLRKAADWFETPALIIS